jgi:hypothetical protein
VDAILSAQAVALVTASPAAQWLAPLPIERDDSTWTYWLTDRHHWFPVSITGVIAKVTKSEEALLWIEAWREVWEPRGNTCHAALQHFANARWAGPRQFWPEVSGALAVDWSVPPDPDGPLYGTYAEWIRPLLAEPLWDHVTVIGAEVMLFDLARNVAGTMDLIVRFADGSCGMADLKTLSDKGKKYDTRAQLGAGIVMAEARYGLEFRCGLTIWAAPGRCEIQTHPVAECKRRWLSCFRAYEQQWRPF